MDFFSVDTGTAADGSENEAPYSPEVPLQSYRMSTARSGVRSSSNRRLVFSDSDSDSQLQQTTPIHHAQRNETQGSGSQDNCDGGQGESQGDGSQSQGVLIELKQMLSKVCKKVEQNERVLKELQDM